MSLLKHVWLLLLALTLISALVLTGPLAAQEQKLVIANVSDVVNMDPAYLTDAPTSTVAYLMFERLARFDEDGIAQPALAESWDVSDDGLLWTFHLRDDVLFHDGTPFNAEAVKYTFDRIRDEEMASPGASDVQIVEEITVEDEFTVSFSLEFPSAAFLYTAIMSTRSGIVSPTAAEEWGQDFSLNPVGTGPFKFSEWEPDSYVRVVRNEDYWGDVPLLDEVEFRPIPEAATQMIELETGGVDMVLRVRAGDLERVQANPDLTLYSTPDYNARYVFYNVSREPMDQLALRQAISHAIPVDMILEAFLGEAVIRTYGVMPEVSWAYHVPEHTYDFDPELAQEILEAAGWEYDSAGRLLYDGEPLVLDLYSPDGRYPMDKEIAAVIQQSLEEIGIGAEISVLEWGAYLSAVDGGVPHLSILGWSQATGEPATMYGPQLKSQEEGGWANAMFYSNPELDALLVEGEIETDLEKRTAIYVEAQEIVAADVPMLPMFSENLIYAAGNHVKGYQHSPAGFQLSTVYIED